MNRKLVLATVCCLPLISSAEEAKKEESSITASAELGLLYKTGNTESADLKSGFDFKYEKELWRSTFDFDFLIKKTEDEAGDLETTDQKWIIESKTNYTLDTNSKNYMYGDIYHEDNKIKGFDTQSSISVGWGREWFKNEVASLFADVGPGYKRDVTRATDTQSSETHSSVIIQAQALYLRKINENVDFKQKLTAKYAVSSGESDNYKAETSITTKLIESLALKFSFIIDHNTVVDKGVEKTDTETALTLVYSF